MRASPQHLKLGLAGWLALLFFTSRGSVPTLQDFGFQNLTVNGHLAQGQRPLLVVVADFVTANPLAHSESWYDDFVFNLFPLTRSVNGYYHESSNGRFFWARGGTISIALADTDRRTHFSSDETYSSNLVYRAMGSGLFNFQACDADGNGHVTLDELQIAIISNDSDGGGAERWAGTVRSPGSLVDWVGSVALLGHLVDFATLCHELSHNLGTLDLYGVWGGECLNQNLTLMSCTFGAPESPDIYELDPWHRMQLGWSEPRIRSLTAGGSISIPAAQSLDPTAPVILYDPALGSSEFFLLEYRTHNTPNGGGYDVNVADDGLAIWHVHQEPNHSPTLTPRWDGGTLPAQEHWRWCSKCQGMHFITDWQNPVLGLCPLGGSHSLEGSGGYIIVQNTPNAPGQHEWRWCSKCQGLFYGPGTAQSHCPAGGVHDGSSSGNYSIVNGDPSSPGQHGWKWCTKCQGLFYGPGRSASRCPADNSWHDDNGSSDYAMLLSGLNYVVWNEGPPSFQRGRSALWHSDQITPHLVLLDGTETRTRLHVRPFSSGAGDITVDWLSELDYRINIVFRDNRLVLSWPAAASSYILETSAGLQAAAWTPITNGIFNVGDTFTLTNDCSLGSQFFRLRKQ